MMLDRIAIQRELSAPHAPIPISDFFTYIPVSLLYGAALDGMRHVFERLHWSSEWATMSAHAQFEGKREQSGERAAGCRTPASSWAATPTRSRFCPTARALLSDWTQPGSEPKYIFCRQAVVVQQIKRSRLADVLRSSTRLVRRNSLTRRNTTKQKRRKTHTRTTPT